MNQPNTSEHVDPRMNLTLADMQQFYRPPQKLMVGVPNLVLKREHKSQAETEAEDLNK